MTCAACSARVEKVTANVPGVNKAEVNLLAGTMQVECDNESCFEEIITAVSNAGYGASKFGEKKETKQQTDSTDEILKAMKRRILGSAACLVVLMYFTMGHMLHLPMPGWYMGKENAVVAALLQFFLQFLFCFIHA